MYRYLILFSLLMLAVPRPSAAVDTFQVTSPDPVLEPWRWRSFPELEGLGLRCMAEDRDGNMWFGTGEGVRCYNGVDWTVYTSEHGLLGLRVDALCAARDGSVYVGTELGISRFKQGVWSRLFPSKGDLPWPVNDLIEVSDGSVWAGTWWGALHLEGSGSTLYTTEETGRALQALVPYLRISTVPTGVVPGRPWSEGIGVMVSRPSWWSGRSVPPIIWSLAPGGPGEAAGLKLGDRILTIDGRSPGRQAWQALFGSADTPVRLTVDRKGGAEPFAVTLTRERVEGTFREFPVYDVYEDRSGAIWFGLYEGEIARWDIGGNASNDPASWHLYTQADGLNIGTEPRITQTRDGTIWTVCDFPRSGVNRFDGRAWTHFRLGDLGGYDINTSILETRDGTLWIGGHSGYLHAFRNGAWTVYHPPEVALPQARLIALLETSDGALWVAGLGQEALRLDYGTSRWTTYEGLNFQCETPDGAQWFLSRDNGIVRYSGGVWTRYGVEDGLMVFPRRLIAARDGVLWAAGSHDSTAATAWFDGRTWVLQRHPQLSRSIDTRAVYGSSDGAVWFGGEVNPLSERGQLGGVLRFDGETWTHYTSPEAPTSPYGIGQTADGVLWFGGGDLRRFDGETWSVIADPEGLATPFSDVVYAAPQGDLWIGTRTNGTFHFDAETWTRYDVRDGLGDNRILGILQTEDGSVWATTVKGVSRFDGQTWTIGALSPDLPVDFYIPLRQSRDGALWINSAPEIWYKRVPPGIYTREPYGLQTVRYEADANPPETEITLSREQVSQPGNTTLAWRGVDPWRDTSDGELEFSWRLDGGDWSVFSPEKIHIFQSLHSGGHTFEVRARDRDFNEDSTPAVAHFTVVPPVWQQFWFIGMVLVFVGVTGFQASRIVSNNRQLKTSNRALSLANKDLFQANMDLRQDRALERVRAKVAAMNAAEDLKDVVAEMLEELEIIGVDFGLCVINIVDEEAKVRRQYGATKQGWSGQIEMPLSQVSEEFLSIYKEEKPLVRQVDDGLAARHLETRKQLGVTGEMVRPTAIVEVPFVYGTVSLSTHMDGGFSEQHVALVEEFTRVMALGYVRFLDFQQLEVQNRTLEEALRQLRETQSQLVMQEKMAALGNLVAGIAHEINTPIGAANSAADVSSRCIDRIENILKNSETVEDIRENTQFQRALELLTDNNQIAVMAGERIGRIVQSLRNFARLDEGEFQEVDLHEGLDSTLALLHHELKNRISVDREYGEIPPIYCAPSELNQVFMNLLVNAIQAIEDRGTIQIETSVDQAYACVKISDTGKGISAEQLSRIFDPGFTTKGVGVGTGLGLSISYNIVQKHKGEIEAESEVGKGSTFTVRVPLVYEED